MCIVFILIVFLSFLNKCMYMKSSTANYTLFNFVFFFFKALDNIIYNIILCLILLHK